MIRRVVKVSCATVVLGGLVGGEAFASSATAIGPKQFFAGTVNGLPANATIKVLCPGPANTGRALPGQPLKVTTAGSAATNLGYTGTKAHAIDANLATASGMTASLARFTSYGAAVAFPTSLPVPCSGRGVVSFDPTPGSKKAKPAYVTVTFSNVGVGPR